MGKKRKHNFHQSPVKLIKLDEAKSDPMDLRDLYPLILSYCENRQAILLVCKDWNKLYLELERKAFKNVLNEYRLLIPLLAKYIYDMFSFKQIWEIHIGMKPATFFYDVFGRRVAKNGVEILHLNGNEATPLDDPVRTITNVLEHRVEERVRLRVFYTYRNFLKLPQWALFDQDKEMIPLTAQKGKQGKSRILNIPLGKIQKVFTQESNPITKKLFQIFVNTKDHLSYYFSVQF